MKISSPLNISYNLFYFRGFFPTLSSSLEYSFFTDHWHQTAVTTFTENGPFQCYTRKTALFKATQIFQKVTKVVVNSQINVSFSPSPHLTVFLF